MEQIENDLKLKSQISNLKTTSQNSNLRVGANLIEAKASSSKKDFIRYYEIAFKGAKVKSNQSFEI